MHVQQVAEKAVQIEPRISLCFLLRNSHQDMESLLGKMVVVGENLANPSEFHQAHGNAIGKTVRFVATSFVKLKPTHE